MHDKLNELSAELDASTPATAPEQRMKELEAENNNLRTVMMAAAVEIQEHWDAHCDADGYGPANLVRRLEHGYPEQYGYNAETVVRLEAENEQLRALLLCYRNETPIGHQPHMIAPMCPQTDIPSVQFWYGKPVLSLSREELLECVNHLAAEVGVLRVDCARWQRAADPAKYLLGQQRGTR